MPRQPPFREIQAVLFDLDGTLVHTRIDFPRMKRAVLELVARSGLDPQAFAAPDVLSIAAAAAARLPQESRFAADVEHALVEIELDACEDACPAPGAVETLEWLREIGLRVGIVTRNSRPAVERLLRQIPLPHETLLTRADTPRVKPDPLHLRLALERLGAAADRSIMVGDHLMDIRAGRAAEMLTLGILLPERGPGYFEEARPDGVLTLLPELRAWISQ